MIFDLDEKRDIQSFINDYLNDENKTNHFESILNQLIDSVSKKDKEQKSETKDKMVLSVYEFEDGKLVNKSTKTFEDGKEITNGSNKKPECKCKCNNENGNVSLKSECKSQNKKVSIDNCINSKEEDESNLYFYYKNKLEESRKNENNMKAENEKLKSENNQLRKDIDNLINEKHEIEVSYNTLEKRISQFKKNFMNL